MSGINIGDKYESISTGQEFILIDIQKRSGGKLLSRPIYKFEYTNRNNETFTCYIEDIEKSLSFGSWIKSN